MNMPISPIVLQRRHAELGRIRLGDKGSKGQPQKLSRFRFTSPSQRFIDDIATLYGGEARPWDNGGKPEFEVYTEAVSIPVVVVKGGMSQWMETWSGGGCVHRCDGVNREDGAPCEDDQTTVRIRGQEHRAHDLAKPTTRLSVMLPELEAIGVWRLESHGWNAAAEIPNAAELAAYVGDLVKANLHLVERRSISDGRTNRFVVPVLDLEVSQRRLLAIAESMSSGVPMIAGGAAPLAIEAPQQISDEDIDAVADATTKDELNALWRTAGDAGRLTEELKARIIARAGELEDEQPEQIEAVVEPESSGSDSDSVEALWQQIVAEAGKRGMANSALVAAIEQETGLPTSQIDAGQFADFLAALRDGRVAA